MSKSDKRQIWIYGGLTILALVVLVFLVSAVLGSGSDGQIVIKNVEADTTIYLDNLERERTSEKGDVTIKGINSGFHTLLVARDGYWPWLKDVQVVEDQTLEVVPFHVPQNTRGLLIPKEDPEYDDLIAELQSSVAPDFDSKVTSDSGNISIWVDGGSLFAEWLGSDEDIPEHFCNETGCHPVMVAIGVGGELRGADFYKGRDDVFIISFGNGVFALEADNRNNQNFQPIYEGEAPSFLLAPDNESIYVLDDGSLMQVAI